MAKKGEPTKGDIEVEAAASAAEDAVIEANDDNVDVGELPSAEQVNKTFKDFSLLQEDQRSALGEIGSLIKTSANQHNIHAKAFKEYAKIRKMDASKRSEYLVHLFHYLGCSNLGPHPDLFQDRGGKELAQMASSDEALLREAEESTVN